MSSLRNLQDQCYRAFLLGDTEGLLPELVSREILEALARKPDLALGLATRWICIPLMVTMGVAALKVHWENGWQAVLDPMSPFPPDHAAAALERLERARAILKEHGDYDWLTEYGNFVISNNGMEWAVTYFVMLLALFFLGGGRHVSVDYWLRRRFRDR
jgi:uncharacterized membrane protein YphA (DoxX/SURF4 family)